MVSRYVLALLISYIPLQMKIEGRQFLRVYTVRVQNIGMLFSDLEQSGSSAMNVSYYNSVIAAVCRHLMLQQPGPVLQ
jgi:hypothetical protein